MFEKKKWRVSSSHKNQKGQVTTVTIATEDETVVRKMLEDPERKKDAGSSMNAKYKTASEKKTAKQLPSPTKTKSSKPKPVKPTSKKTTNSNPVKKTSNATSKKRNSQRNSRSLSKNKKN